MFSNFPMSPPSASNFAAEYDFIFYVLLALTLAFTALVGVLVIYFSAKYRKGTKVDRSRPIYEHLKLELTWTIIPLLLGLVMFFFGARLFIKMRTPPKDATDVYVIGKQWMWHIQHSNGIRENNSLHVAMGKPVKLTCISQDVLHAFYIPAFRQQIHVVPGRYTTMWFTPTQVGTYHLFCGMYCGTQHSEMGGTVVVMEPREFAEWEANGGQSSAPMSMSQSGAKLFSAKGCNNCHGAEDTMRAPSLVGLMGTTRRFSNASPAKVDESYLRESILRPHQKLTSGYEETMPIYEGQLTEEEIINLIAYMKVLGSGVPIPATSNVNRASVPNDSAHANGKDPLTTNALQAERGEMDTTPTIRTHNPSVNAIAAEEKTHK